MTRRKRSRREADGGLRSRRPRQKGRNPAVASDMLFGDMSQRRTAEEEEAARAAIAKFLRVHSGTRVRCGCGRRIAEMPGNLVVEVLFLEEGVRASRPWVMKICAKIGVEVRRQPGPPPLPPDEKKARSATRYQRWLAKLKKNPKAYALWTKKRLKQNQAWRKKQKVAA